MQINEKIGYNEEEEEEENDGEDESFEVAEAQSDNFLLFKSW